MRRIQPWVTISRDVGDSDSVKEVRVIRLASNQSTIARNAQLVVLLSVPYLCVSRTDIQILIVITVNADNTFDQCALDALQRFRKTVLS